MPRSRPFFGLFARYALLSLVPVLALGAVLAAGFRHEAEQRGLHEGAAEATVIARTGVEPLLEGHALSQHLTPTEWARLDRLARVGVGGAAILRLRLRDERGLVVFASDRSGATVTPDDEVEEALHGHTVTLRTHLNSDSGDQGSRATPAVEAYRPLYVPGNPKPVGVLELYLPYTPIRQDVEAGMQRLYRDLGFGLAMLYLAGFVVCAMVSAGLRRQTRAIAHLASHDPLTDLANRTRFHELATAAIAAGPAAVAVIDLDRFKEINDALGHRVGDELLQEVAGRLARHLGASSVARLGGDEFGVVLRDVIDPDTAFRALQAVLDDVDLHGLPIAVEASIGYALAPEDGADVDDLLQRADVAMYVAKARHAGVVRYDAADDDYRAENVELVADFRRGVDAGELVLHYQPKAVLDGGRVDAVEALVRWNHPTRGLLAPDAFVPLIEPTQLVDRLTDAVLESALADMASLPDDIGVAINVSARNLGDASFADRVLGLLRRRGIPTERLTVEITETALVDDPRQAAVVLGALHAGGVRVSIDDFGQGHTSLAYLSALPVDELKIDRSFVAGIPVDAVDAAIVRSIVDLGHNLSLRVVAEGVETPDVLDALRAMGCDVAQGYLLARPMPLDALAAWLSSRGGHCAAAVPASA